MDLHDDIQLLAELTDDSQQAFRVIYSKYAQELYRFARRNIHSNEDCEEMLQDVFTSIWLRRKELKVESLRKYLFTAIKYMIIRYINRKGVRKRYEEHFKIFSAAYEHIDPNECSPDTIQEMLIKSLTGLPQRCQYAMRLRITNNLSNSEIAAFMSISKKTVELYMSKAISHMKGSLPEIYRAEMN